MSPEITLGKMPMCGQTVQVLSDRGWINKPFYGFTTLQSLTQTNSASIIGLTGYTDGDQIFGEWLELRPDNIFQGCSHADGVEIIIEQSAPINLGKYHEEKKASYTNNVVSIFNKK